MRRSGRRHPAAVLVLGRVGLAQAADGVEDVVADRLDGGQVTAVTCGDRGGSHGSSSSRRTALAAYPAAFTWMERSHGEVMTQVFATLKLRNIHN
jgi:hypothetical protein